MLKILLPYFLGALLLLGCAGGAPTSTAVPDEEQVDGVNDETLDPAELVIMSHDSFAISEAVLREFELKNNVRIVLLPAGDTGAALNQAILSKNDPLADLFFGVDNSFMSRALAEDLFEDYRSPILAEVAGCPEIG